MNSSKVHQADHRIWTREFIFVLVLSLSYFYCLPLLRTGVVLGITASEIRLYDLVFIVGLFVFIFPNLAGFFNQWSRLSSAHRFLLYWLLIGLLGLILTLIESQSLFIIGVIRYYRFFSFSAIFVLGFLFIRNKKQLLVLYDSILIGIVIVSVIGSLQALGFIPNLWPDYYDIYVDTGGGYLSTSILAPNHTHYSLVIAIGIVMIISRFAISFKFNLVNIIYLVSLMPFLYSMIASKGRSGWLVLIIFLIANLVMVRRSVSWILTVAVIGGIGYIYSLNLSAGSSSVQDILLYRSINAHKELGRTAFDVVDEDNKNWIEKVDDNRWYIYQRSIDNLLMNPQYLVIGAGFQNASRGIGKVAVAAHNAYLNVVAEHGIIGLIIYLLFLLHLLRLALLAKRRANSKASYFLATNWICLFLGLLAANFFGEIIYPGRALFTFLGTFFIVAALFLHPAWRSIGSKKQVELKNKLNAVD